MRGHNPALESLKEKFRKLLKSDQHDEQKRLEEDLARVLIASEMLQISEFRFFNLAYSQWYGNEIETPRLEYYFDGYIFDDIVPHWARHFARKVITSFEEGTLNPLDYDIIPPASTPEKRSAGYGYSFIIIALIIGFIIGIVKMPPIF